MPVVATTPVRDAGYASTPFDAGQRSAADTRLHAPDRAPKEQGGRRWPGLPTAGFACACLAVFAGAIATRDEPGNTALPRDFDQAASYAGLALEQVSVGGHHHTSDSTIFDALQLEEARSLLAFDVLAAKARLEQLPWVEQASVSRMLPAGLNVTIVERSPVAVWKRLQRDGVRHVLIDRTGRSLAATLLNPMPLLPVIEGDDADQAFPNLLQLQAFAVMAPALARIERIGQRRWTFHLKSGQRVLLPSAGEAAALSMLHKLATAGLDPKLTELDLRLPGRLTVRYDDGHRAARTPHDIATAALADLKREARAP